MENERHDLVDRSKTLRRTESASAFLQAGKHSGIVAIHIEKCRNTQRRNGLKNGLIVHLQDSSEKVGKEIDFITARRVFQDLMGEKHQLSHNFDLGGGVVCEIGANHLSTIHSM